MKWVSVALAAILLAPGLSAQRLEQSLVQLAVEAGRFAGSAEYCNIDQDKVDNFISRILGRIAAQARDDTERALLRIEFKNQRTAASVKEPVAGCEVFAREFEAILAEAF